MTKLDGALQQDVVGSDAVDAERADSVALAKNEKTKGNVTEKAAELQTRHENNAADSSPSIIELDQLCVKFDRPVLDHLSANLRGRCIGLLGPNGAGKTTLLNTLLGFNRPSSGRARIFNRDITKNNYAVRDLVGYMPERDAFINGMTGIRFVRYMAELSGLNKEDALERAHQVFFYVGLGEARYRNLETYSLGMKQLAKLAQAIVHGPKLLFLDEPTNGLDPPARARMLQLIREIRDSGDTHIVIASHILRDVEECCDEVLVLKDGRIAKYCNLEAERRSNKKFLFLQIRGNEEKFVESLRGLGCEVAIPNRRRIKTILPDDIEIQHLYALARELSVQIRHMSYKRDSLEDIFMRAMEQPNEPLTKD